MFDKLKEECGVFGVYNHPQAGYLAYLGIYALQHRGQESCGIVSSDGRHFIQERGMGLVYDFFSGGRVERLEGTNAIGHTRYSTAGGSNLVNVQPLMVRLHFGKLALAHNGNLVNAAVLKKEMEENGNIFQTTSDSEVLLHLIAKSKGETIADKVRDAVVQVKGAFCLLFLSEEGIIAVRDPYGVRPLSIGRIDKSYVVASETCAFDLVGAEFIRDVEPGEMIIIDKDGMRSERPFDKVRAAFCVFEYIYFSRPDSNLFGYSAYQIRKVLGRKLAEETGVEADIVIPVPDSGVPAAMGYAEAAGLPFEMGLMRNHYVGRSFIQPKQQLRDFSVKIKLNPVKELLKGKRVVVIDDSVVRGTTSRKIIDMIRQAGAKEIHMRISSPPIRYPCFYGIDTPSMQELIANNYSIEGIKDFIRADSLQYLSNEGMLEAIRIATSDFSSSERNFCTACFAGNYPIEL